MTPRIWVVSAAILGVLVYGALASYKKLWPFAPSVVSKTYGIDINLANPGSFACSNLWLSGDSKYKLPHGSIPQNLTIVYDSANPIQVVWFDKTETVTPHLIVVAPTAKQSTSPFASGGLGLAGWSSIPSGPVANPGANPVTYVYTIRYFTGTFDQSGNELSCTIDPMIIVKRSSSAE